MSTLHSKYIKLNHRKKGKVVLLPKSRSSDPANFSHHAPRCLHRYGRFLASPSYFSPSCLWRREGCLTAPFTPNMYIFFPNVYAFFRVPIFQEGSLLWERIGALPFCVSIIPWGYFCHLPSMFMCKCVHVCVYIYVCTLYVYNYLIHVKVNGTYVNIEVLMEKINSVPTGTYLYTVGFFPNPTACFHLYWVATVNIAFITSLLF